MSNKDTTSSESNASSQTSTEALADRRTILLEDDAWQRLADALNRPVSPRLREEKPRLARLLSEPSALD